MVDQEKSVILTIRLIRSFQHHNLQLLVLKVSDLNIKVSELKVLINEQLKKSHLPPPFKNFVYDSLKIEHFPFKAKSSDPCINCLDDDVLMLDQDERPLTDYNIVNETEISYFKLNDYLEYKSQKGL